PTTTNIYTPSLHDALPIYHPDDRLVLQIALTQVTQRMGIRRRRRKHGDYRADVLAVDLLDADQAAGLPRAVADGLPQARGGRCFAPGRSAPDQNKDEEMLRQRGPHIREMDRSGFEPW